MEAVYGEHIGLFNIDTMEMIEGDLPGRALKLVNEWAKLYRTELKEMWDKHEFRHLPPLD
ncbi:DUF4160 domain-containing protein [Chlorobium sp. KB01]|uniref:DUF4160 domain-containing protein n=1 Tax=Chlorobium sp. KB01 TaxID=1917528 RepID=UPI0009770797|nr:DUF4160 domain-containing protein [Chlorobium sp. KB01]